MPPEDISTANAASDSLTQEDRDTIGEMTNIGMGAAVSTLSAILGQEADLTSPDVAEYNGLAQLVEPFPGEEKIFVFVQYVQGFSADSGLLMKLTEAKMLAAMIMGGTEDAVTPGPLSDLEKNSVAEVLNQMLSASATSMSSVIHRPIEIGSPEVVPYDDGTLAQYLPKLSQEPFISVSFDIKLGSGKTISMVQYTASADSKGQVVEVLAVQPEKPKMAAASDTELEAAINHLGAQLEAEEKAKQAGQGMSSPQSQPSGSPQGPSQGQPHLSPSSALHVDPVMVQPVEFASFDNQQQIFGEENKNLSLVMDVSLSLTVELGKTELSIKDVLELTRGSVIELDRVAGEPVDLLANGKLIAKGEVVVIEDNFGLRITSIVSPADRLRGV